jgi:hypothetical protein
MPPIRSRSSTDSIEQEGRILLAIQAIKNEEIIVISEAARRFKVPKSTLLRRLKNTPARAFSRANNYKLTEIEEESLQKMDSLYRFSWISPPPFYYTRNGESFAPKAWNYPGYFCRRKLGDELYETTSSSILSVFETV